MSEANEIGMSPEERERLLEIAELDLLSDEVDEVLDQTVREAARRLDLPISLITVVLDEAQHFLASQGLGGWLEETGGTPGEWSFCVNAVRSRKEFVVEDATDHPVVRDNPLVHEDGIRCYAGIPLITSRGNALGTLCVIGTEARRFAPEELDALRTLARRATERIEERRQQSRDRAAPASDDDGREERSSF